jgi:hypothetical protein
VKKKEHSEQSIQINMVKEQQRRPQQRWSVSSSSQVAALHMGSIAEDDEDDSPVLQQKKSVSSPATVGSSYHANKMQLKHRGGTPPPAKFRPLIAAKKDDKENETPRMRKDSSAEENVARRSLVEQRRVSFTPPRSYFSGSESVRPVVNNETSGPSSIRPINKQRTSEASSARTTTIQPETSYEGDEAIEVVKEASARSMDGAQSSLPARRRSTMSPGLKQTPHTSTMSPILKQKTAVATTVTSPNPRPVMSRSDAQSVLQTSEKMYHPPTQLHEICYSAKSVDQLMHFLRAPHVRGRDLSSAAARKDKKGRIPLHVLAENHSLAGSLFAPDTDDDVAHQIVLAMSSFGVESPKDKKLTKFVLEALLSANPTGATWKDHDEMIPFERSLVQWTRRLYALDRHKSNKSLSSLSRRKSMATETFHNVWASTSMSVSTAFNWAGRSLYLQSNPRDDDAHDDDDANASEMETGTLASAIEPNAANLSIPTHVGLNSLTRFSIKMISLILDELNDDVVKASNRSVQRLLRKNQEVRSESFDAAMNEFRTFCQADSAEEVANNLVEKIASIPHLVMTMFLLEDDTEREWVKNSIMFQRIAVHPSSVGPWINMMLQHADKKIARRGLDCLHFVSNTIEASVLDGSPHAHDDFLEAISQLEGFIPSLLALEEREMEEAATTLIVRSVLDKMISRPFAVSVVFFDFVFLCVLMIGFRYSVNQFLLGKSPSVVIKWIYVANTGIFYFIIRELGKGITILERTRQASIYLWSFWNITDILSTLFALCSTMALRIYFSDEIKYDEIDGLRALLAITTGFLWLRALSLLKSLNIQLATFVLAILQICKDILWFLIILGALVASFSQMFYTMLLPAACATDADAHENPQCSQAEYYLRVYTILGDLGDFDQFNRDQFNTAFSVFLVVLFSFLVVIILLNVLIAIVSDSYEKCLVRSHCLFGRARVLLIAELVSFQNLLRKHSDTHQEEADKSRWWQRYLWNRGWSNSSATFFVLSALVMLLWLIGETAGYFAGERYGNFVFSLLSVLVNVLLFVAIVTFLSRGAAGMDKGGNSEKASSSRWYGYVQRAMSRVLGSSQGTSSFVKNGETDEWRGRLNYLQQEMERISEKTNSNVVDQIKQVEQHVAMSENQVRSEMGNLECGMSDMMTELREMEKRNLAAMQQMMEALSSGNSSSRFSLGLSPQKPSRASSGSRLSYG